MVLAFWLHAGAPRVHAEALTRQAGIESGFRPCVENSMGHFLYGWVATRRQALARFAGTAGCPSLQAQLRSAQHELEQPPYSAFWAVPPARALAVLRRCYGKGRCR